MQESMQNRFGPIHLRFAGGFFGESGIMLKKLSLNIFEGFIKVFFFLVIGLFTSRDSTVHPPVSVIGTEGVIISATPSALLGRIVRCEVCDGFHAHLVCQTLSVA